MRIPFAWRGWPSWCESHSHWRGWPSWSESHSLWRGKPLEENLTTWRREPLGEREGDPLEANPIRCREGGGGTPWGESHPLGEEGHLDRVGASMKRILFALEKGTPMKRIHRWGEGEAVEVHSLWRGWTPWRRFPLVRRRFTLLEKRLQKQDRWRRLLDDDDLEEWRIWTWMTESIRRGRNPWRSVDLRTPTPTRLHKS